MSHPCGMPDIYRDNQVPNTGKEVRFKIIRNIGTAFVRMGQFQVGFSTVSQIQPRTRKYFTKISKRSARRGHLC